MALKFLIIAYAVYLVNGDVYLHSERGSNNRCNENTATRKTANRLFDSQNNERGGYNVGDRLHRGAGPKYEDQYRMQYFQSSPTHASKIFLEWTNQHGCGGNEDDNPHKVNCNFVLQFNCQPDRSHDMRNSRISDDVKTEILLSQMRDGVQPTRNGYANPVTDKTAWQKNYKANNNGLLGMQEPYQWYDKCVTRKRNKGLFTADQKLTGDTSIHTRQNANGNRNGYECPEERDYYPYWHPTDWKDIMVYAQNLSMCDYYQKESFNVKSRYECVEKWTGIEEPRHFSEHNNKKTCEAGGGEWLEFRNFLEKAPELKTQEECEDNNYIWARPIYGYKLECLVPLKTPDCAEAPWTRVNHNGNGAKGDLETPGYVWNLPHFPSLKKQRCVLRIRYNISTDDYDPYNTDSSSNGKKVISNDPLVDIGAPEKLQLNINTAQFGRTFQDRSHVFKILPRPKHTDDRTIINIKVRGKRGNIVQTYPAVEYDFSPTNVTVTDEDIVHIQWTGSNTHNNNQPAGDGQSGDAGEGKAGSDRSNLVAMADPNHNFPSFAENRSNLFSNIKEVHWTPTIADLDDCDYVYSPQDVYVQYASAGYYACVQCDSAHSLANKKEMDGQLNTAPASYRGMLLQFNSGKYYYMCTRNNSFTNRSQKGCIIVEPAAKKK